MTQPKTKQPEGIETIREILDFYFNDKRDVHNAALQINSIFEQALQDTRDEALREVRSQAHYVGVRVSAKVFQMKQLDRIKIEGFVVKELDKLTKKI